MRRLLRWMNHKQACWNFFLATCTFLISTDFAMILPAYTVEQATAVGLGGASLAIMIAEYKDAFRRRRS